VNQGALERTGRKETEESKETLDHQVNQVYRVLQER